LLPKGLGQIMARNHNGQMALYEVVNREKFTTAQKKELARVAQAKAEKAMPVTIAPQQPNAPPPKTASAKQSTVWKKKPSMFGLVGGKIETYVPYPIAVTIVMGLALLLVIVFQVGHFFGKHNSGVVKTTGKSSEVIVNLADTAKVAREMARMSAAPVSKHRASAQSVTSASATMTVATERDDQTAKVAEAKGGEYVIVLAEVKTTQTAKDLEPAKQYFDEHGVSTEIKNYRGAYFLVTTEKYDGFSKSTAGYDAVEKIKQVGAKYKPPQGYGGFGSKPFSDAYGRKM
jgi:hypothetical protein